MTIEDTRGKTVYRSMVAWLVAIFADPDNDFPSDLITIIDVELVPNYRERWPDLPIQDTGLFSNPNDQHVQMLGGQWRHTEFKTWLLWRRFGDNTDRISNEAFLEKLRRAIQRATTHGIFPQDGRRWRRIQVNGGMFPSTKSADNTNAVYQIPLKIEYVE